MMYRRTTHDPGGQRTVSKPSCRIHGLSAPFDRCVPAAVSANDRTSNPVFHRRYLLVRQFMFHIFAGGQQSWVERELV
jgi:hypothetical protein